MAEVDHENDGDNGDEEPPVEKFDMLDEKPEFKEEVAEVFDMFDKEKLMEIEIASLGTVLRWLRYNPLDRELRDYAARYDKNNSGKISLKGVYHIVNERMTMPDTIDELIEALKLFDTDKDGKITCSEFRWFLTQLGDKFDEQQVDDMLKEVDPEKTGFIEVLAFSKIAFAIKEEKPKEDKKDKPPAKKK